MGSWHLFLTTLQFNYDVIIETYQISSFFLMEKVVCSILFLLFLSLVFALLYHFNFLFFSFLPFSYLRFSFLFFFIFTAILRLFSHVLNLFVCFFQLLFVRFSLFPFSVLPSSSVDLITRPNIFFCCLCWYR